MGKIAILYHNSIEHLGLLSDLECNTDCTLVLTDFVYIKSRILKTFRHLHISRKINSRISIPFKYKWYSYSRLLNSIEQYSTICVFDGTMDYLDFDFFREVKKRNPSIRICLFLINSYDAGSPVMEAVRERIHHWQWDSIYSFDQADCEKYGFEYTGFNYYSKMTVICDKQETDAFFVGGIKGNREHLILDTFKRLHAAGVRCDFWLRLYPNYGVWGGVDAPGIHTIKQWRPYEDVVQDTVRTGCILEILQNGQSAPSLRYFEAVCYNKKLLTTNHNIVDYPFYDERYMKVFDRPDDIDLRWIKEKMEVDYHYNDEFSPVHLLRFLKEEEHGKR